MAARKLFSVFGGRNSLNFAKLCGATSQQTRNIVTRNPIGPKVKYLERGNGNKVAYRQVVSKKTNNLPGVVFCSGFQSNMNGVKAMAIEEYCRQKDLSYVRFDYQGCGQSDGDIQEMTLTDWKGDMMAILDQVTAGPQVVVGSSMGGWLMLFAAMERPHRVHSLVGIATAADFPTRGFSAYPKEVHEQIERDGVALVTEGDYTYVLTKRFVEDARQHQLRESEDLHITCPVHLLHGLHDEVVPYENSVELAKKLFSQDVQVVFSKAGDHRFSQASDIQLVFETLDLLVFGAGDVRELAITSWSSISRYPNPGYQTPANNYQTFHYRKG